jgi:hypothetical protein
MLKTAGGSVGSDSERTAAEERPLLIDENRVPDFFDHWMEEYASKVAPRSPSNRTAERRANRKLKSMERHPQKLATQ